MINKISLFGHIYNNDDFVGHCVPVISDENIYFITASHVIFGNNYENEFSNQIKIHYDNEIINIIECKYCEPKNKSDLCILLVENIDSNINTYISSPIIQTLFASEQIFNYKLEIHDIETKANVVNYVEHQNDNFYLIKVHHDDIKDHENGLYADDAMRGISGSGVFYFDKEEKKYYLTGIISSLPSSGYPAIQVIDLSFTKKILSSIKISSPDDYLINIKNVDTAIINSQVLLGKDCALDWLNNKENEQQSKRIREKCSLIYYGDNNDDIENEIIKNIKSLLKGNSILHDLESNSSCLYETYNELFDINCDKTYIIECENKKEVLGKHNQFKERYYEEIITEISEVIDLDFWNKAKIKKLVNRDITHFLNECDLRYRING